MTAGIPGSGAVLASLLGFRSIDAFEPDSFALENERVTVDNAGISSQGFTGVRGCCQEEQGGQQRHRMRVAFFRHFHLSFKVSIDSGIAARMFCPVQSFSVRLKCPAMMPTVFQYSALALCADATADPPGSAPRAADSTALPVALRGLQVE